MISVRRVRAHHDEDADDCAEQVCNGPPCEVGEVTSHVSDNGGDECNQPRQL